MMIYLGHIKNWRFILKIRVRSCKRLKEEINSRRRKPKLSIRI